VQNLAVSDADKLKAINFASLIANSQSILRPIPLTQQFVNVGSSERNF